ncbi:hypothetical protein BBK82_04590 [Lentzea guizhouensis]|uniref:Helix-turn-helix domain-containing protein n=1 Tax=Lentzea guizhouensis TaxID=1586287 RepID=A0A1B2HCK5_9PSEU|nr:hypothetical protein [Lentzea guizhouensis]ANZ35464.1 hypothetical protein BBK82_04590 [Lentzea guizhouensis]
MGDFYGIAEIADAMGLSRQLVTVWRKRRSHGIPEPDAELASGPIWRRETVEPWIDRTRGRLGLAGGPESASRSLRLRTSRRVLRLAALMLEEPLRPRVLNEAAAQLRDLAPEIDSTADDVVGALLRELVETVRDPDVPAELLRVPVIESLPLVTAVARNSPDW